MITGRSRLVVAVDTVERDTVKILQGDEETVATFSRCERESVRQFRRDQSATLIVEKDLAGNSDDAGINALGVW